MFGGYVSDNLPTLGYIDVDYILSLVSEAEIYSMVFGIIPKDGMYITSPFRNDTNPGCYFKTNANGELLFYDWANSSEYITATGYTINMICINCFQAVQIYYDLDTFPNTLQFILDWINHNKCDKFIRPTEELVVNNHKNFLGHTNSEISIYVTQRDFTTFDRDYWKQYGISSQNLIDDNIHSIGKYVINREGESVEYYTKYYQLAYQLSNIQKRTKLYFPNNKHRFLNTYRSSDIGCFNSLPEHGELLVISKSYKDCRVLRNFGLTSVWFQNETVIPKGIQVDNLFDRFKQIVIFYDNDEAGINGAEKVQKYYQLYYKNSVKTVRLKKSYVKENITDISDLYRYKGKEDVKEFITSKILKV